MIASPAPHLRCSYLVSYFVAFRPPPPIWVSLLKLFLNSAAASAKAGRRSAWMRLLNFYSEMRGFRCRPNHLLGFRFQTWSLREQKREAGQQPREFRLAARMRLRKDSFRVDAYRSSPDS